MRIGDLVNVKLGKELRNREMRSLYGNGQEPVSVVFVCPEVLGTGVRSNRVMSPKNAAGSSRMSKPMKYTSEEVPKNWNGKDWHTYKWAMMNVFKENDLKAIAVGDLTLAMLATASAEKKEEFNKKQIKIMRMIGTSAPPKSEAIKAYTIRRLENELWAMKLAPGGDANLHLCKMFNLKTELGDLQHGIADNTMVDMLLESLPEQVEFENLKSSIYYGADPSVYTPKRVRELVLAAAARQKEFRSKQSEKRGGQKHGNGNGGVNLDRGGKQQSSASGTKKTRQCYVCGSEQHLKANCPEKTKKQSGADENEQKWKPRGDCTLRQDDGDPSSPTSGDANRAGTTGVTAIEPSDVQIEQEEDVEEPVSDHGADDVEISLEGSDQEAEGSSINWWYFDTASNAHVTGNRSLFVSFTEDTTNLRSIRGVTPTIASRIEGVGTVALVTEVKAEQVVIYVDDVFYTPGAEFGLFSPGLAYEQGFEFDFDNATRNFTISMEGRIVVVATPQEATWWFQVADTSHGVRLGVEDRPLCNYTVADGVGSLTSWHERLCHTCPQYLKTMADKGLVRDMMLTQRQQDTCDACHLGKQKRKAHRKKLDRATIEPNQVVYADLLFPGKSNGTQYEVALVIMDGYSRFVTVHLLHDKHSKVVNKYMKEYVLWAERQARRNREGAAYKVKRVLSDKGGEFFNDEIDDWYHSKGIEHEKVGPKSSQLNLCERTHQSLEEMTKATMAQAGFPRSLWPEAMHNAMYVKNRVYNKGTQGIPYEMMFGVKPDVHHIRKFGALAYVHVPLTPGRTKQPNAKIGYVLGYAEDVVGGKVFFPEERTAKFVADLRVAEDVVYRDRHDIEVEDSDLSSLHFTRNGSYVENAVLEEGEETAVQDEEQQEDVETAMQDVIEGRRDIFDSQEKHDMHGGNVSSLEDVNGDADAGYEPTARLEYDDQEGDAADWGTTESVAAEYGSVIDGHVVDDKDEIADDEITVSNGLALDDLQNEAGSLGVENLQEDNCDVKSAVEIGADRPHTEPMDTRDAISDESDELPDTQPKETGKRTHRSETPSEEVRVERDADKLEPKKTRTGLREYHERRRPRRFDEYVMNVAQKMEEIAALKDKGVIMEIPGEEMPEDALLVNTMWVYALKSDHQGYVIRFKARIVALGNYQRPGIDFKETFAPVARMSSFRLLLAIAAELGLSVYGGDINTAYLNAKLAIRQYLRSINGYPCNVNGNVYVVLKALYGLRQSGREWNSELNQWLTDRGYQRSLTEPCLYYRFEEETIVYVLVYVDDILVATNNEQYKVKLFEDLNKAYGIKDQGLLTQYLGVEVEQTPGRITIRQGKYAREILTKFGYEEAHAVGNPMEVNARLAPIEEDEKAETSFPYREAVGMLMYLATSTRPDLAFALGQLSRFVANPSPKHVGALKRVLRYVAGTLDYGITYSRKQTEAKDVVLEGFCDSDWANDPEQRKSTTGFVFTLAGGAIAWMSRRQSIIALSTAEAEYVAACEASMEAVAESNILQEKPVGMHPEEGWPLQFSFNSAESSEKQKHASPEMKTQLVVAPLSCLVISSASIEAEINAESQLATTESPLDAFLAAFGENNEDRRRLRKEKK
ncbi:unnamed protein product [Phytophthora fragariaefolia]|uniref:Unnamed protein product n=1 Tax=Phytophthora fragariaefolia TaxID=1490495 RepID=A0A9W6U1Z0_9STRA|nr:unnamed protein product [Phytophthora fragariaefolia]